MDGYRKGTVSYDIKKNRLKGTVNFDNMKSKNKSKKRVGI